MDEMCRKGVRKSSTATMMRCARKAQAR